MQAEEQQLVDGLFRRLKAAETQSGPRDSTVETHINQLLSAQPAAPYYMAQALIVQEAALQQLNERINALQDEITRLQQPVAGRGSFLSGLFGTGQTHAAFPPAENVGGRPTAPGNASIPGMTPSQNNAFSPGNAPSRSSSFLGGALQTAAGVAGGVVLAEMLTGMFRHTQPEEIINIINETPSEMENEPWRNDNAQLSDTAYGSDDDFARGTFSDDDFNDDDFNDDDFNDDSDI